MTTVQLWGMVAGLFLSFVVGLLLKKSWAAWLKFLVVIVASAVVGVIDLAIAGELRWSGDPVALVAAIVAASQATFFFFINRLPSVKEWLYGHFIRD